jgi:hypothetical protein
LVLVDGKPVASDSAAAGKPAEWGSAVLSDGKPAASDSAALNDDKPAALRNVASAVGKFVALSFAALEA